MEYLISDLSCALPLSGWTDADSHLNTPIARMPAGKWRILDYSTQTFHGRALQTSYPTSWPLTIPLSVSGWYAIWVGMAGYHDQSVIEIRLSQSPHWQLLRASAGDIQAIPWTMADVTGQSLEIRYPQDLTYLPLHQQYQGLMSRLFFIKLMPIPQALIDHLTDLRTDSPRLVYFNDGHGLFWNEPEHPEEAVPHHLKPFQESDWETCCFATGGADLVNYPSQIGTLLGIGAWDALRLRDLHLGRLWPSLFQAGIDPMQQAIETTHQQQQRFWAYIRPQAWVAEPPFDHAFRSQFFVEHPEYRCHEADGTPLAKLSLAYPEVRQHLNKIILEVLEKGADGIAVAFIRGTPLVRYEEPVCQRFYEHHQEDMRELAESDPRVITVWREIINLWMAELRQLLDEQGASPRNARRELAVIVGATPSWNQQFGLAVDHWIEQGWIDAVLPCLTGYEEPEQEIEVAAFAELLAVSSIALLPSLGSWKDHALPLQVIRERADRYYQEGATGLSRWDTPGYFARLGFNDPVALRYWVSPEVHQEAIPLKTWAGVLVERFAPLDAF